MTVGPMAPTAKRVSRRSSGQRKLSFGKGVGNRVTKPNASPQGKSAKKEQDTLAEAHISTSASQVDAVVSPDIHESGAVVSPDTQEQSVVVSPDTYELGSIAGDPCIAVDESEVADDQLALALTARQIKGYWQAKEESRKAARVHQEELSLGEKILREWDMSGQFGPCIGITRLRRWRRAKKFGLSPPIEVLAVLLGKLDTTDEQARVGKKAKMTVGSNDSKGMADKWAVQQHAHVDVLMGNRTLITA